MLCFDLVEQCGAEPQNLARSRIADLGVTAIAPLARFLVGPASHIRDRGERHEGAEAWGARSVKDGRPAAARMTEDAVPLLEPASSPGLRLHDAKVLHLASEGILGKGVGLRERLAIRADAAPREIELDRAHPGACDRARQVREEAPAREALESVADDDRGACRRRKQRTSADGSP